MTKVKIINEFPPNHKEIAETFDLTGRTAVFTYGDTIYNPYKCIIPKDLLVHEKTHIKQQGDAPEIWWNSYLNNTQFRLEQELEAYQNQFKFYKTINKGWMAFLKRIAYDLSSLMYGHIISYQKAFELILYDKPL